MIKLHFLRRYPFNSYRKNFKDERPNYKLKIGEIRIKISIDVKSINATLKIIKRAAQL